MAHRNIEKVCLYSQGFIVCRDPMGRQTPSLQGVFKDVVGNIRQLFEGSDVKWVYIDKEETELTFEEWLKKGESSDNNLEEKQISNNILLERSN